MTAPLSTHDLKDNVRERLYQKIVEIWGEKIADVVLEFMVEYVMGMIEAGHRAEKEYSMNWIAFRSKEAHKKDSYPPFPTRYRG